MDKKKKKSKVKVFGVKLKDILQLATIVGGCVWAVHWLDEKFVNLDTRLDKIETDLAEVKVTSKQASDLLDTYLTWRFIYINNPARKNLVPIYDPQNRTLDFADPRK